MTLRQRIEPIRSRELLDSARGQPCTLEFVGICDHGPAISAHIHDECFGMGQKADDTSTVHACDRCHMFMDQGGWIGVISQAVLRWHIIRAMQRTLRNRIDRGLIVIPLNPERLSHNRPAKARKPPEQRAKIPQRTDAWPAQARKIPSRPFSRKPSDRTLP